MKILILANFDIGLYKFRKELIARLLQDGHEVFISLPDGEFIPALMDMGCHYLETEVDRRGMNPIRDMKLLRKYLRILRTVQPELVISYTIKPNIYGGLACRMKRIPYAANITGLGSAIQNGGLLRKMILTLYRVSLKKAKTVFFENSTNRDFLASAGVIPKGHDCVLHGAGINLEEYPYCEYPKHDFVRFLFVGRIMKEKGVDELFCAAKKLKEEFGKKVEIQLVGLFEEEYRETVSRLVKEEIISFAGYQSDVRPFYRECDCVVLPSYHEGMSNVLLEAAATGRPMITSDIPGCREAVLDGESGFLCESRNFEELYERMWRFVLLPCEQREAMGIAGRKHIEKEFDKKKVVDRTTEKMMGDMLTWKTN